MFIPLLFTYRSSVTGPEDCMSGFQHWSETWTESKSHGRNVGVARFLVFFGLKTMNTINREIDIDSILM